MYSILDASGRYTNGLHPTSKRGRFSAGAERADALHFLTSAFSAFLVCSAQLELRYSDRNVYALLAFDRKRLQRK